jgi:HPt (histidine-containing phosphotransfer) domain-containing protein
MTPPGRPRDISAGLLTAAGGDTGLARELAEVFLAEVPVQLSALAAAADAGDPELVRTAAHTLKGSAGALGFTELARQAQALELQAQAAVRGAAEARAAIERLCVACDEASRAARAYLEGAA